MSSTAACKREYQLNNTNDTAIVPCGLVAWSLFNDTYNFSFNGANLMVNNSGISWKSDRQWGGGVRIKNLGCPIKYLKYNKTQTHTRTLAVYI